MVGTRALAEPGIVAVSRYLEDGQFHPQDVGAKRHDSHGVVRGAVAGPDKFTMYAQNTALMATRWPSGGRIQSAILGDVGGTYLKRLDVQWYWHTVCRVQGTRFRTVARGALCHIGFANLHSHSGSLFWQFVLGQIFPSVQCTGYMAPHVTGLWIARKHVQAARPVVVI